MKYNTRSKEFAQIIHRLTQFYKRDVILLINYLMKNKGLTYRDIGEILGRSPQSVQSNYKRGSQDNG